MTDSEQRIEIDDRVMNAAIEGLHEARKAARLTGAGTADITLPATAIDGLIGMLRDPIDAEFWYRRRQFIFFFGLQAAATAQSMSTF